MTPRETAVWVTGFGWLAFVMSGFWLWERYDATPGAVSQETLIAPIKDDRWRLTVFAHPRCPCTRATIRELMEIATARPKLSVRVLFVLPAGTPEGWERGDSWDAATRIPGAEVACDADGANARRFGAKVSGHVVLTDPCGTIVFRGGLTPARGRTGESIGRNAVLTWSSGLTGVNAALVFGCDLFTHDE